MRLTFLDQGFLVNTSLSRHVDKEVLIKLGCRSTKQYGRPGRTGTSFMTRGTDMPRQSASTATREQGSSAAVQSRTSLRALAHPLRWRLIDLLDSTGQATATQCAEALGETVASCAYHLSILGKYG